jgi:hypothetical protein
MYHGMMEDVLNEIAKGKRETIVDKTLHRILKIDSATRIPLNTGGQLRC